MDNLIIRGYLKEVINLIEFDSYKQRAAQAAENIKLAGESL